MVWTSDEGQVLESPSLSAVDSDAVDYWKQRSDATENPILKARYSGLVWDLSQKALGETPHHSFARKYVGAVIESADKQQIDPAVDGKQKLKHALSLARALNDRELVMKVRDSIIQYEDNIAQDDKPGLWGFAFELLVDQPGIELSEEQENHLVHDLEQRFSRIEEKDPWPVQRAAELLGRYYRKRGRQQDSSEVIRRSACAFEERAKTADPLA